MPPKRIVRSRTARIGSEDGVTATLLGRLFAYTVMG
jgi:hypothetical protein